MWGALGRRSFAKLTLCIVPWVVSFLPLRAFVDVTAAVARVCGGCGTGCLAAVVRACDGRRNVSFVSWWHRLYGVNGSALCRKGGNDVA